MAKRSLVLLMILCVVFMGCANGIDSVGDVDFDTDIVIVGGGIAGVSAALAAAQQGADVILVEKREAIGGASALGGGGLGATGSVVQKKYGITDTPKAWVDMFYMRADQSKAPYRNMSFPVRSDLEWLVDESVHIIDWLSELGMTFGRPWELGLDLAARYHSINNKGYISGGGVVRFIAEHATELGVDIRVETKAVKVLQTRGPGSRVIGIELEDGSKIYAKAVILAAGGFTSDLNKYINGKELVYSPFSPALSTFLFGEGIDMAVAAGGVLWEDPWANGVGVKQGLTLEGLSELEKTDQGMYVDSSGARVGFEGGNTGILTNYAMFAQKDGGRLFAIISDAHATPAQEQLNSGRVFKGSTIAELASNAGINAAKLQSEVSAYNGICDAINALNAANAPDEAYKGVDPLDKYEDANTNPNKEPPTIRPNETRKTYVKIEGPAFYALEMIPDICLTFGGVKTKTGTAEVLDKDNLNRVIPGLYAAGENANRNFYDKVYMSGSATMQAAATGRAAGMAAAAYAAAK